MVAPPQEPPAGGAPAPGLGAIAFDEPVVLVGGGDLSRKLLDSVREIAPTVVAVDGGADRLRDWSVPAAAVVGDMDSIEDLGHWRLAGTRVLVEREQYSTDLAKSLRLVRAPLYLAVGFLGSRLDHSVAAMGVAARPEAGPVVLVAGDDVLFASPPVWQARLPRGARLSILATRRIRVLGASGLHWPPDGLQLDLGATRGVSNLATGGRIRVAFDRSGALLACGREHLQEVVRSLTDATEAAR